MEKRRIVLASKSPRRIQLLEENGVDAICIPSNVEEIIPEELTAPDEICEYLACLKGEWAASRCEEGDIVISADTVVHCRGELLGKPRDKEDARRMLSLLSGSRHYVLTGMCIIGNGKKVVESVSTEIVFKELTSEEIEEYISSDEPYDKAGGYGIQETAGGFVKEINGDFDNVVGLPVTRLLEILRDEFSCSVN